MVNHTTDYSASKKCHATWERKYLSRCHLWGGSQQHGSRATLVWVCVPKAPRQQHWGMSLEAPNQGQTHKSDAQVNPELWPEAKKKKHTHTQTWALQQEGQFRSGQLCSLRAWRLSPVPQFLLVKFSPLSYAAERILIRPVRKTEPKKKLQETPLLCASSIFTALKLSGFKDIRTTEVTPTTSCYPDTYGLPLTQSRAAFQTPQAF